MISTSDSPLLPDDYGDLKDYVINLKEGKFSQDNLFQSSKDTVDAIFETIARQADLAGPGGLPIVLWAHGGLVSERNGLESARDQVVWWKLNGVYPLFFVWHSGLLETLGEILHSAKRTASTLDVELAKDHTGDPLIEFLVRMLGGRGIWSAMKMSAELASKPDGGAFYVAKKLASLCQDYPTVTLHAVGHSAGSIFHSFFVPTTLSVGVSRFQTVQFLAPALTVDNFRTRMGPILNDLPGQKIGFLTMLTMRDHYEQNDNCLNIYKKSLLYLIHFACEHKRGTPILGMEASDLPDKWIQNLFNIPAPQPSKPETGDSNSSNIAEVIWSRTKATTGDAASQAIHHGDFDFDPETMNSVLLRVLGRHDLADIRLYPEPTQRTRALRDWDNQHDLPIELDPGWPSEAAQQRALNAVEAYRKRA